MVCAVRVSRHLLISTESGVNALQSEQDPSDQLTYLLPVSMRCERLVGSIQKLRFEPCYALVQVGFLVGFGAAISDI